MLDRADTDQCTVPVSTEGPGGRHFVEYHPGLDVATLSHTIQDYKPGHDLRKSLLQPAFNFLQLFTLDIFSLNATS
jgi:hypothetical protein